VACLSRNRKKFEADHKFQQNILGISWKNKVRNEEVRQKTIEIAESETYHQEKKTEMVRGHHVDGRWQTTEASHALGDRPHNGGQVDQERIGLII